MKQKRLRPSLIRNDLVTVIYALKYVIEDYEELQDVSDEVRLLHRFERMLRKHDFAPRPQK